MSFSTDYDYPYTIWTVRGYGGEHQCCKIRSGLESLKFATKSEAIRAAFSHAGEKCSHEYYQDSTGIVVIKDDPKRGPIQCWSIVWDIVE